MTGSIICGVDDSESAKGAARVARGLSAQLGSQLVFVRAVDDGSPDDEITAVAERLHHLAESASEVDGGAHWLARRPSVATSVEREGTSSISTTSRRRSAKDLT
jgi:nucleotide-binding universal stress UspA family protein